MARYSADHKKQTRQRLLETARAEFREHGFEDASIDKLMKAAGLTRGGFYAHFASKEALVEEVLRLEPGLLTSLHQADNDERVADLFDEYLDPAERKGLIQCPLVAHPIDAIRGGETRTALYSAQITGLIESLQRIANTDDDREAILVTVLGVGAAILSSAMSDEKTADRIEEVCREEIRKRLVADPRAPRERPNKIPES